MLKGDTSAASEDVSGAKVVRCGGSTDCGLLGILGFPARFTGGGTGGAEEIGRPPLCGSVAGVELALDGKRGFVSRAGVAPRLGILKVLVPFEAEMEGEGGSIGVCEPGREG